MEKFVIYSLEVAVCLAFFFVLYWIFLRKETFFRLNRFFLLASVLVSLAVPGLNVQFEPNSLLGKYLSPIAGFEQDFANASGPGEGPAIRGRKLGQKETPGAIPGDEAIRSPQNNAPVSARQSPDAGILWLQLILLLYFLGASFFMGRFFASLLWFYLRATRYPLFLAGGVRVFRSPEDISPFSFLGRVFIGTKEYPAEELTRIISHENVHIRQKHSIDLILFELLLVFQWFNPFAWLYRRAIKITHEYLADEGALGEGIDPDAYQYSLLRQALSDNQFSLSNGYGMSAKSRVSMMLQKRSSRRSAFKILVTLPVLLLLFSAFALDPTPVTLPENKDAAVFVDTPFKEVSVPIEYLRSLQGEYVSTGKEGHVRRIIFTELLGYLYGFDAGYNYKIVPIGGESFVNPDDRASLIFNSTDKTRPRLLLFGKIDLERTDRGNRSMGFTLANVMMKKGIPAALDYYRAAKDSAHYVQTEGQINYAGYQLLLGNKLNEAAALFKLNTEIYPEAFNTYDSYAEALLKLGDKQGAIENYKKSVALNPGSKNGLKMLAELGVSTEGFVKKVELKQEELDLIEGDYLSTNEKNRVRWIRIKAENNTLYGHDNGYRYSLIPMGNGKFINPDDGASLVFNTTDKRAVTLSLFGKINLRKVKTVEEPARNLEIYAGLYLPSKQDAILTPMEIVVRDNRLIRLIPSDPEGPNKAVELKRVTEHEFFYTDGSGRSLEFVVNEKGQVVTSILRRFEARYTLRKQ